MPSHTQQICLFGASPNTGNQGVSALCWSTVEGIAERVPAELCVYSYGQTKGRRVVPGSLPPVPFRTAGMSAGRRVWRTNHLRRAQVSAWVGLNRNEIVREIGAADALLDVSGGDSFTDLYGASRFNDITGPKKLALRLGTPMILLPQTYGPFNSPRNQRTARDLIANSTLAFARDRDSYRRLQHILGHRFDPERHRLGVDLAFSLRSRQPRVCEPSLRRALFERGARPLIGLNISGLLANRPATASQRFDLACDYRQVVIKLITRLLESSNAQILLVPHVHAPQGHYESDLEAGLELVKMLPERCRLEANERLTAIKSPYDAAELKWIIKQTDWFCGSRMHSTIAALSGGVAACALAYSVKTKGVFDSCGTGEASVDLRKESTDEAVELALWMWQNRHRISDRIARQLPKVESQSDRQLDEIAGSLRIAKAA